MSNVGEPSDPGLYVETDFLLALIKEDDWLRERAETILEAKRDELWTTRDTLLELMMVAYREGWNVERVVADANALLTVTGDTESLLAAASHVEENDVTPFDALHLVNSAEAPIVSSDATYDGFSDRIPLEPDVSEGNE